MVLRRQIPLRELLSTLPDLLVEKTVRLVQRGYPAGKGRPLRKECIAPSFALCKGLRDRQRHVLDMDRHRGIRPREDQRTLDKSIAEGPVVGNDDADSIETVQGIQQKSHVVFVQVVGRLVENQQRRHSRECDEDLKSLAFPSAEGLGTG